MELKIVSEEKSFEIVDGRLYKLSHSLHFFTKTKEKKTPITPRNTHCFKRHRIYAIDSPVFIHVSSLDFDI